MEFTGHYRRPGRNFDNNIFSYFLDNNTPDFEVNGDTVTIKSYETNRLFCAGGGYSPCRKWQKLVFNTKTKTGIYTDEGSNNRWIGGRTTYFSVKFACK